MSVIRLLTCVLLATGLAPAASSRADDTARISVTYLRCPQGYAVEHFDEICDEPMTGRPVEVRQEGPAITTRWSDETGRAAFELAPGEYWFSAFPGHTVDQSRTDCVDRRAPFVTIDGIPELSAGAEVDCRVYTSFSTFAGGAIPARDATLTVRVRYCIPDVPRGDYAERCAGHADAEAAVTVTSPYPERGLAGRTNSAGDVTRVPDQQGPWRVEVASNHDLLDRHTVCERADYPGVPMVSAYVETGVAITCDVYLVPAAYRLTTAQAEGRAAVEVRYRRCPVGYEGGDHAADCGETLIGNAALGLLVDGRAAGTGYTDLDGVVRFEVGAGTVEVDPAPLGAPDDRIFVTCAPGGASGPVLAYPLGIVAGDKVACEVYLLPVA